MPTKRDANGHRGGNGRSPDVPRWVRVLFDQHEVHMAALQRAHEEHVERMEDLRVKHEATMAEMRAETAEARRDVREARRQTREIIMVISRIDAERKAEMARIRKESERNEAAHRAFMEAMEAFRRRLPPAESSPPG